MSLMLLTHFAWGLGWTLTLSSLGQAHVMASGAKKAARQDSSVTMPLSAAAATTVTLSAGSPLESAATASAGSELVPMATGSPPSVHPKPSHSSSAGRPGPYSAVPKGTPSEGRVVDEGFVTTGVRVEVSSGAQDRLSTDRGQLGLMARNCSASAKLLLPSAGAVWH